MLLINRYRLKLIKMVFKEFNRKSIKFNSLKLRFFFDILRLIFRRFLNSCIIGRVEILL